MYVSGLSVSDGQRQIISDVSFIAIPGKLNVIMGANRSAKSTLLKTLAGKTDKLSISYHEVIPRYLFSDVSYVAWIDTSSYQYEQLTVLEILKRHAQLYFSDTKIATQVVRQAILNTDLVQFEDTRIGGSNDGISAYYRIMVAIAIKLLTRPQILFIDKPLTGLYPHEATSLISRLKAIQVVYQCTFVMSTARPYPALIWMFDHIIVLRAGVPVFYGSPQMLDLMCKDTRYPLQNSENILYNRTSSCSIGVELVDAIEQLDVPISLDPSEYGTEIEHFNSRDSSRTVHNARPPCWHIIRTQISMALIKSRKTRRFMVTMTLISIVLGVILGLIFSNNTGKVPASNESNVMSYFRNLTAESGVNIDAVIEHSQSFESNFEQDSPLINMMTAAISQGLNQRTGSNILLDLIANSAEIFNYITKLTICLRSTVPQHHMLKTPSQVSGSTETGEIVTFITAALQLFDAVMNTEFNLPSVETNRNDLGTFYLPLAQKLSPYLTSFFCCAGFGHPFSPIITGRQRTCTTLFPDTVFAELPRLQFYSKEPQRVLTALIVPEGQSLSFPLLSYGYEPDVLGIGQIDNVDNSGASPAENQKLPRIPRVDARSIGDVVSIGGNLIASLFNEDTALRDAISHRANTLAKRLRKTRSLIELPSQGFTGDFMQAITAAWPEVTTDADLFLQYYEALKQCPTRRCQGLRASLNAVAQDISSLSYSIIGVFHLYTSLMLAVLVLACLSFRSLYNHRTKHEVLDRLYLADPVAVPIHLACEVLADLPFQALYTLAFIIPWLLICAFANLTQIFGTASTLILFSFAMHGLCMLIASCITQLNRSIALLSIMIGIMTLGTGLVVHNNVLPYYLIGLKKLSLMRYAILGVCVCIFKPGAHFGMLKTGPIIDLLELRDVTLATINLNLLGIAAVLYVLSFTIQVYTHRATLSNKFSSNASIS